MFRFTVKNLSNEIIAIGQEKTIEELEAFKALHISKGTWGKLEDIVISESEDVTSELDTMGLMSYGKSVKLVCDNTLEFITGLNAFKNLDGEQIDFMQETYNDVETWLNRRRPGKAYGLLSLIVVDGTIVTEEDKSKILNFLGGKLTELSEKYQ